MFFRKSIPIGLDIGSSFIKIAQIVENKKGYELTLFDLLQLPHGAIVDGIIEDRGVVVSAIQEILAKNKVKSTDAVIALAGHSSVIIKRVSMPTMNEEELSKSIRFEAEQYIPFDINDVNIDFQILRDSAEGSNQMDVVLIAVKKNVVEDYVSVVETAGLTPVVVDVAHFAIGNLFEYNYGHVDECIALVNVGGNFTNLNILKNSTPLFTRDTPIGGNVQSEALMRDFGVTYEDAERLKRGLSVEGIPPESAGHVILEASDEIFHDIQRSIDFFKSSVTDDDVNRIILTGGVALTKDFAETMADRLGVAVEVMDTLKNITISDKLNKEMIQELAPIGAVAMGLALRRAGDR